MRSALPLMSGVILWSGCYLSHELTSSDEDVNDPGDPSLNPVEESPRFAFEFGCEMGDLELAQAELDLVLVVDDSSSMAPEQEELADELPALLRALITGDLEQDGVVDFPPVRSLRTQVVTTTLDGSPDARPVPEECIAMSPQAREPFQHFERPPAEALTNPEELLRFFEFSQAVSCLAQMGEHGSDFEQPLESALRALNDTRVLETGLASAFVREESVVALVILTDEDDCSIAHPEYFNPNDPPVEELPMFLRCDEFGVEALYPTDRYVVGLGDVVHADARRLVVATIAGLPPDLMSEPLDYATILADSRMARIPSALGYYPSVCPTSGLTEYATAARRLAATMDALGDQALMRSVCNSDYRPALDAILRRTARSVSEVVCR